MTTDVNAKIEKLEKEETELKKEIQQVKAAQKWLHGESLTEEQRAAAKNEAGDYANPNICPVDLLPTKLLALENQLVELRKKEILLLEDVRAERTRSTEAQHAATQNFFEGNRDRDAEIGALVTTLQSRSERPETESGESVRASFEDVRRRMDEMSRSIEKTQRQTQRLLQQRTRKTPPRPSRSSSRSKLRVPPPKVFFQSSLSPITE